MIETAGDIGLLFSPPAKLAAICLAAMLIAMFPANSYAAKRRRTQEASDLPLRIALQIIFIAALALASREP